MPFGPEATKSARPPPPAPPRAAGARADFVASGPKGMHALAKLEAWTAAAQP